MISSGVLISMLKYKTPPVAIVLTLKRHNAAAAAPKY